MFLVSVEILMMDVWSEQVSKQTFIENTFGLYCYSFCCENLDDTQKGATNKCTLKATIDSI